MPSQTPHEFQSLNETAEQVSRAPTIETGDNTWAEEDIQSPRFARHVRHRRRRGLENSLLTRVYSNRPHIPGEDSGSDTGEDDTTTSHRYQTIPEGRPLPDLSYPRRRRSFDEETPAEPTPWRFGPQLTTTQPPSIPPQNDPPSQLRQRLQTYISNHTRQREELGAAYGFDRSEAPIRARRAPPRPQTSQNLEEAISRAAVFERRLERALREYRSARRAWSSNNALENDVLNGNGNSTSSDGAAQNLTTSLDHDTLNLNSIHDFLRSARRGLLSTEESTNTGSGTERQESRYLPSLRNASDLSQHYMHRWQRESNNRLRYGSSESISSSSTFNDRTNLTSRTQSSLDTANSLPYQSGFSGRNSSGNRHIGQTSMRVSESFSHLTSGPLFDTLRNSRPGMLYNSANLDLMRAQSRYRPDTTDRDLSSSLQPAKRDECDKMQKPIAILNFFAQLREEILSREALRVATQLAIYDLNFQQDPSSDLVMSISDLPDLQYTSWLEPGVTWRGSQYADVNAEKSEPATETIRNQLTVKVVLHSVDWGKMKLTGTIEARQPRQKKDKKIESFFEGEIIDFRNYGLDTSLTMPNKRGPSSDVADCSSDDISQMTHQDLEMDLIHWLMLGPFKRGTEQALSNRQVELQPQSHGSNTSRGRNYLLDDSDPDTMFKASHGSTAEPLPSIVLTADEENDAKLVEMTRLLSSAQWLQNNLNQAGWILMRWKEQCFIPSTNETDTTRSSPQDQASRIQPASRVWTTVASERENSSTISGEVSSTGRDSWSLSINGFYYVALNRQTGEIEALYHEPGSILYQKLEMSASSFACDLGVRSSFNLVEFR